MKKWTRRAFLATGGVIGGGLLLGVGTVFFTPNRLTREPQEGEGEAQINTWVSILKDGTIRVMVPHCDMGQGALTGCAMMMAEEMNADWEKVQIVEAPPEDIFANDYLVKKFASFVAPPLKTADEALTAVGLESVSSKMFYQLASTMRVQVTGGSASIRGTGSYGMRVAGATALALLTQVAAGRWGVPASECRSEKSVIYHDASRQQATFAELADEASDLDAPAVARLKQPSEFTLVGTSRPRLDTAKRVDGSMRYGTDFVTEGMLYATVEACPVQRGTLVSVDHAPALAMPGVERVIELPNAVAVVARSTWEAFSAIKALRPVWDDQGNGGVSTESLTVDYRAALEARSGEEVLVKGDGYEAIREVDEPIKAEYIVPYLAHAAMEPLACTARVADGKCEVWAGNQDPMHARTIAAAAAGLEWDDVTVHNFPIGGAFGRRLPGHQDFIDQGVRIAAAMSPQPVKLTWTREEEMRQDLYRPFVVARYQAGLDADGRPTVWVANFVGDDNVPAWRLPYDIPHQSHMQTPPSGHLREGALRSVEHSQHAFFAESFIDELAHQAGRDPYEYRRELLKHNPRFVAVLDKAAEEAGWGSPLPEGQGRGIAIHESFETIVAVVVEVEVDSNNQVRVTRCTAAVDCGQVVNPDGAAAQIEGGVIFGLSAGLMSEITLQGGRVVQSNFWDHQVCRMADAPDVDVHFVHSNASIGGMGEPGTPPTAPALCNAVFAATGKRIRQLPLSRHMT